MTDREARRREADYRKDRVGPTDGVDEKAVEENSELAQDFKQVIEEEGDPMGVRGSATVHPDAIDAALSGQDGSDEGDEKE